MLLDVILAVVVLISALLATVRGFVREVLSIASWAAAAAAGAFFYKPVVPLAHNIVEKETYAIIISVAAIFFVTLIVASYITMKIADFVIDSRVGAIDRALGFLFGAVRGLALVVITFILFKWIVIGDPLGNFGPSHPASRWIANSATEPTLSALGERLMTGVLAVANKIHPNAPDDTASGQATPPEGAEPPADTDPDTGEAPAPDPKKPALDSAGVQKIIGSNPGGAAAPTE
jgi:membrane protein required for colicin V production